MYSRLHLAGKYLWHLISASNGRGHGIHSPFVYDFVRIILSDDRNYYAFAPIEELRTELSKSRETIEHTDYGAGSAVSDKKLKTLGEIVRQSSKPAKLCKLLFRIVDHYQPKMILELGTSAGLSTCYLAAARPASQVITIEGSPIIAKIASKNFERLGLRNIHVIAGTFDRVLPDILNRHPNLDLAFIDGNHRKAPTLSYFDLIVKHASNPSIMIFDDIHWSKEMEDAWHAIREDERAMLTIDLFFLGIVFLNADFKVKQHFSIRF
ncbi:MAG TPA: class I SAM-dependent methyltransferase [Puia sp.]|nr:class I SAM-dependent methyltransferase [Puia sp.]